MLMELLAPSISRPENSVNSWNLQGRSQDFSKGGHTGSYRGYSPDCHLNIVGCLFTKRLTKGGHGHPRTPPPLATPLTY